jgi:hypothetical protein
MTPLRAVTRALLWVLPAIAVAGVLAQSAPSAGPDSAPVMRYALLIGVSNYPDTTLSLRGGPLNDVALMQDLLVRQLGFTAADVLVLRDDEGTRRRVINAIRTHLGQATAHDLALLYFSGHGVQLPAPGELPDSAEREPDGQDEALLFWGQQSERMSYLLDDEVGILLDGLSAGRTIIIIDACHAGTATRGVADSSLPWEAFGPAAPPPLPSADLEDESSASPKRALWIDVSRLTDPPDTLLTMGPRPLRRDHLLLSASLDNQIALSGPIRLPDGGRRRVGLFTAALYQEALRLPATASLATLMDRVRVRVNRVARLVQESSQTPTAAGPWQDESLRRLLGKPVRVTIRPRGPE